MDNNVAVLTSTTNDEIVRSLNERGLETIPFDHVKYTNQPIGEGFWGEVFKIQCGDNVMVLKTTKSSTALSEKYSVNEVEIMRLLDHPNIVKFLGVCVTDNNKLYPLLEYINGGTLEDFLQNETIQIPWITRLGMALDIACGMKYLHAHSIMHRDLTSSNILLRMKEGTDTNSDEVQVEATISDFGLAKDIQKERAMSLVGSVDWMAPEVILGKQYNKKADVFSYGIILCEMIGRCEADPDTSVVRTKSFDVDFDDFTRKYSSCPIQFLDLAKQCCQLDPENRPSFDDVYMLCHHIIQNLTDMENNQMTRKSLEQLNIADSDCYNTTDEDLLLTPKPLKDSSLDDILQNEPRFSGFLDDLLYIEEIDGLSMRSTPNSLRSKTGSCDFNDKNRRLSLINPMPSVNRNTGKIVLTIRNELSPIEGRGTPPDLVPSMEHDLTLLNEREECKVLEELSTHSTLVLFDPTSKLYTRRNSRRKHNNSTSYDDEAPAPGREVPFGRRQFSKKKKITPLLTRVFNKNKSPKQDDSSRMSGGGSGSTTTGLLNFFKTFKGSSKHSSDHGLSKSKISKRKTSDDKESGEVTKFSVQTSPKHKKNTVLNNCKVSDLTPTNSAIDPLMRDNTTCTCGKCKECFLMERNSRNFVNRNESYRAMKPFRTQSVPVEYEPGKRPPRTHSFRDKLSFLPDRNKQTKG